MTPATYLYLRNLQSHAEWAVRWSRQGGSKYCPARPLMDLRNEEDLRRYRIIEFKRRALKRKATVINLAHERMERVRRKVRNAW